MYFIDYMYYKPVDKADSGRRHARTQRTCGENMTPEVARRAFGANLAFAALAP